MVTDVRVESESPCNMRLAISHQSQGTIVAVGPSGQNVSKFL